ncbi:uncharacterized protein [Magallana gigas]
MAISRKRAQQDMIPFATAKEEAMEFIHRGEDKPGCAEKDVDSIIGKGLFAEKAYRRGEFIVEYAGDLISRKEGLRREKSYPARRGSCIFFFVWNSKKYCLDATESSRKGRFANDAAPGDVQCNASVKCLPSKGKPYLALFANRKIGIGEEIRYDYGVPDLPWRKHCQGKRCKIGKKETACVQKDLQLKECRVLVKKLPVDISKVVFLSDLVHHVEETQKEMTTQGLPVEGVQEESQEGEIIQGLPEDVVEESQEEEITQGLLKEDVEDESQEKEIIQGLPEEDVVEESQGEEMIQGLSEEDVKESQGEEMIQGLPEEDVEESQEEEMIQGLSEEDVKESQGEEMIQGLPEEDVVEESQEEEIIQRLSDEDVEESQEEKITQGLSEEDVEESQGEEIIQGLSEEDVEESQEEEIIQRLPKEDVVEESQEEEMIQGLSEEDVEESQGEEMIQGLPEEDVVEESQEEEIIQGLPDEDVVEKSQEEENIQGLPEEDVVEESQEEEIIKETQDIVSKEFKKKDSSLDVNTDSTFAEGKHDLLRCGRCKGIYSDVALFVKHRTTCHAKKLSTNVDLGRNSSCLSSDESQNLAVEDEQTADHQNPTGNQTKSKTSRPRRPCPFCGTMASRLTDHMKRKHKMEESVKAALALPKELRDREFQKIKKEGIFLANKNLLKEKNPDYSKILAERNQGKDALAMCSLCKGFYHRKIINRHKKRCASAEGTTDYPATYNIKLVSQPNFSHSYVEEILNRFQESEISSVIRSDDWIQRYGYLCFQNFEGTEKRTEKRSSLMSNLRRLARLFLEFKQIIAKENPSIELNSCSQMFDRDFILYIQEAICSITTDKDTNAVKNGLKVSLRYLISDVCKVMRANYLLMKQDEKAEEMAKFISVLQLIWPSFFASAEESVVKKRQSDLRRPVRLPSEKEIEKLRDCTKEIIDSLSIDMYETFDYSKYSQLRDAVVCRLTLFNARRGGEPSRMTVKDWEDALQGVWIDQTKVEHVEDDIEKKLLCENKIAYIHASKVTKLVPLLIPKDCWQAMKILTDYEVRRGAEINEDNTYAFPNIKHSKNHASGWVAVNNLCKKAGLERNISATDMRHYVATSYALLDVPPNEREMFYKHLGHSKQMNENVYQCPPAMKTITQVGKFLNQLEGNFCTSISSSKSSGAREVEVEVLSEFIELMAPGISLPDVLNFYTKIDEEHVTVDPEELEERRHLVLNKDVQCQAKQFFTEDAWLGIMNTLKMLAADTENKIQKQSKTSSSGLKRTIIDDDLSESEVPGPSRMKRSKKNKFDSVSYICEDNSSEEESSNNDNISKEEEKSPVVKGQRHTWLPEENAAIERFFNSHIDDTSKPGNKGKLHVASDIRNFILSYPEILKDFPKQKKIHLIRTKILNLRRKKRENAFERIEKFRT